MSTKMSGSSSGGMKGGDMLKGLSRKNPKGVDASMSCKGGSVNSDATRGSVAPTPRTLGPRDS